MKNLSEQNDVDDLARKENIKRSREILDLKTILNTSEGRRYIWRILSVCGIYTISANNSGSWTYFNEGKRSVGLNLMSENDPDSYILMMKENKEYKESED